MTRREQIFNAIRALQEANEAQQEIFEGERSYKLHQAIQDAIDDLDFMLEELEAAQ